MLNTFFGTKIKTNQLFDSEGSQVTTTLVRVEPLIATQVKTVDKDGYFAVQCAISKKTAKQLNKPQKNHLKAAKLKHAPKFTREIRTSNLPEVKSGDTINITDILQPGDKIKATSKIIGRGFTGVIKRWGFSTGPRTHGQSDRWRSPGSIGQRSDPGRVWKGKKMAGHSGNTNKTIRGLQVIDIDKESNILTISGTIPGHRNTLVTITKIGKFKNPITLPSVSSPKPEEQVAPKEETKPKDNQPKSDTK